MFKIQEKSATFKAPVSFKELDENGRSIRHTIDMEFKRLGRKAFDAALNAVEMPKDEDGNAIKIPAEEAVEINADQVRELVVGWKIIGKDGEPFPYTRENVVALLDSYPGLLNAIFATASSGFTGEIARKN